MNKITKILTLIGAITLITLGIVAYLKISAFFKDNQIISPVTFQRPWQAKDHWLLNVKFAPVSLVNPEMIFTTIEATKALGKPILSGTLEDKICKAFGNECVNALKIARAESQMNCEAIGDRHLWPHSYGLFQIRGFENRPAVKDLLTCDTNIQTAVKIQKAQGWQPWSTRYVINQ